MAEHAIATAPWCVGELLVGGPAAGPLVALDEPLSFWGGVDDESGRIIDGHHPQFGTGLAHTALLMGATRGSSSSTSTLLECIRRDTAPAMLLLTDTDPILVIAVVVAWEIYGRGPTVVLLAQAPDTAAVTSVRVDDDGRLYAQHAEPAVAP
jgi:predicted aconitase with swiveling domain